MAGTAAGAEATATGGHAAAIIAAGAVVAGITIAGVAGAGVTIAIGAAGAGITTVGAAGAGNSAEHTGGRCSTPAIFFAQVQSAAVYADCDRCRFSIVLAAMSAANSGKIAS